MVTTFAIKLISDADDALPQSLAAIISEFSIFLSSLLVLCFDNVGRNFTSSPEISYNRGVDLRISDNTDNDSSIGLTPNTTDIQEKLPRNEKMSVDTPIFLVAVIVLITLVGALILKCCEPKAGLRNKYASNDTITQILQDQDGDDESVDDDGSGSSAKSPIFLHKIYQPQDHNQILE